VRAAAAGRFGDLTEVRLVNVAKPTLRAREVLIQVAYAGVNPSDWKEVVGALADSDGMSLIVPGRRYEFPMVTGRDAAGIVAEVGAEVADVRVGDRVVTASDGPGKSGTFAEYVAVRSDRVAPMPSRLDFAGAAAYPVAALTAWQAMLSDDKGRLEKGNSVLIHGAAGGVGSYAVQFARLVGLPVAATCRAANADYVRSLGADHIIDYQTDDIESSLLSWRPGGVDALIDAVGVGSLADPCALIRPGGRWVSVATMTADGDIEAERDAAAERHVEKVFAVVTSRGSRDLLKQFAEWFDRGELQVPELTTFDLSEAAKALEVSRSGRVRGKMVLRVANLDSPKLTPSECPLRRGQLTCHGLT
jgi:NADPH:quinone reductase-like Zn-dependent oxidoreductase